MTGDVTTATYATVYERLAVATVRISDAMAVLDSIERGADEPDDDAVKGAFDALEATLKRADCNNLVSLHALANLFIAYVDDMCAHAAERVDGMPARLNPDRLRE